ncbi:uncharacterized protein RCC_06864 [Ramularia collo-cygni]|uniref:Secreted protein n=1 Tax=Ramularia collo-cygni TaxID=112498 RepID=A0A2D3VJB8_9PEZI|nr:uncharacterized protein RCC_06864 [Ramularia collo-cygni]CZT21003.1 uncharacterized protein RCC_06864 [Ramularia collo-cygni]
MHINQLAIIVTSLAIGSVSQFTDCSQFGSGFGYICSRDGSTVRYCQPDQSPQVVDSQYCDYGDCQTNQSSGSCYYGVGNRNRARGPTDCSQVNADGGYICSSDYRTLYQCSGFDKAQVDYCPDRSCFASTTGDHGECVGKN